MCNLSLGQVHRRSVGIESSQLGGHAQPAIALSSMVVRYGIQTGMAPGRIRGWFEGRFHLPCESTRSSLNIIWSCGLFEGEGVSTLPCEPTRSTRNIIWSCGLFEGKGISTSRVSPPGPLSISYGHVGCLKARAFPPPV
jgi:hypothetical protein